MPMATIYFACFFTFSMGLLTTKLLFSFSFSSFSYQQYMIIHKVQQNLVFFWVKLLNNCWNGCCWKVTNGFCVAAIFDCFFLFRRFLVIRRASRFHLPAEREHVYSFLCQIGELKFNVFYRSIKASLPPLIDSGKFSFSHVVAVSHISDSFNIAGVSD